MTIHFQNLMIFIRTLSRIQITVSDREFVSDFVKRDIPWQAIIDLAHIEGVDGFLYRHLKDWDNGNVPEDALERFKNTYRQTRDNTLRITKMVKNFSDWFSRLDISVIALQGLSLLDLYGDPGLRALGDIDFLVRPSDKKRVKNLLRSLGYSEIDPRHPDILFGKGIWVDLHSHVLNLDRIQARKYLFPENLGPMWDKALPLLDRSEGIMRLDPFDNFIALSAHALKHSYSRLMWLVDLNESVQRITQGGDGWTELIKRSKKWGQEKSVLYALLLIQGTFHLFVPARIKKELGI